MSSSELWQKNKLPINHILNLRKQLIYGRTQHNVKKPLQKTQVISTLQELAMTSHSTSTQFKLKKPVSTHSETDSHTPLISNAAPVESVKLEENPRIEKK